MRRGSDQTGTPGSNRIRSTRRFGLGLLAAVAIIATGVVVYAFASGAAVRQLNAWKLLPQPERLSELYYENHTELPTSYAPGKPQTYSFTVHNLEGRNVDYSYTVTQQSQDGETTLTLAEGSFVVADNAWHTQNVTVTPQDAGARSQIITNLRIPSSGNQSAFSNQSIHFWVKKEGV